MQSYLVQGLLITALHKAHPKAARPVCCCSSECSRVSIWQASIDASFIFNCIGVLVNASVPSLGLVLFWSAIPAGAVIASCTTAMPVGVVSWIVFTKYVYHQVRCSGHLCRCVSQR